MQVDEGRYSRQIYAYGKATVEKLVMAEVLLIGGDAVAAEVSKNLVLSGIKRLVVVEQGSRVGEAAGGSWAREYPGGLVPALQELNPEVQVSYGECPRRADEWKSFHAVVIAGLSLDDSRTLADSVRQVGVPVICGGAPGAMAWVFCDFGDRFLSKDVDGEDHSEILVGSMSGSLPARVTTHDGVPHGLQVGQSVVFQGIEGVSEQPVRVESVESATTFFVDLERRGEESGVRTGGVLKAQPMEREFQHVSMGESLRNPADRVVPLDFSEARMTHPATVHVALLAASRFHSKKGREPDPTSARDLRSLSRMVRKQSQKVSPESNGPANPQVADTAEAERLALVSRGRVVGLCAFAGALLAQEVVKAVTHKYSPLSQWVQVDVREILPDSLPLPPLEEAPVASPTLQALRDVIGDDTVRALRGMDSFVVGSGAIGCELVKNLALMDVGRVTLADDDHIEKSNLSRQFLFRSADVGQPKAEMASRKARSLFASSHTTFDPRIRRVDAASESEFTDAFFEAQSVVLTALDSVAARLYVDSRCVANGRPMLESGTLACKGHVQVIVPHVSEPYGASRDPPEREIPFCTLKSFPYLIEHTVPWARSKFESLFATLPRETQTALQGRTADSVAEASLRAAVRGLRRRPASMRDSVATARAKYEAYFVHAPRRLLEQFPPDRRLPDGSSFWTGAKRMPKELPWDPHNSLALNFVRACALLLARVWQLSEESLPNSTFSSKEELEKWLHWNRWTDEEWRARIGEVPVPAYIGRVRPVETEDAAAKAAQEQARKVTGDLAGQLREELRALMLAFHDSESARPPMPESFEKDDDSNHHMDFVHAASNLRASVYGLAPADRLRSKQIAGKIVPAVATTTSAVAGWVAVELVKLAKNLPRPMLRNAFLHLGTALFALSEPAPPAVVEIVPGLKVTPWDQWRLRFDRGSATLGILVDLLEERARLPVASLTLGSRLLYISMDFPGLPSPGEARALPLFSFLPESDESNKDSAAISTMDLDVAFENSDGEPFDETLRIRCILN